MVIGFLQTHMNTIIPLVVFYGSFLLFFYLKRGKNLTVSGFIFYMFKSGAGIKLMKKIGNSKPKLIQKIGYVGVAIAILWMVLFSALILVGTVDGLLGGEAEYAKLVPIVPGLTIAGIHFPFVTVLISIIVALVVHEGAHGVMSIANKLKVNSTGIGLLGPLPFAFVEPDEKQLEKSKTRTKQSVFAAGILTNTAVALLAFLAILFVLNPITTSLYPEQGIEVTSIEDGSPAEMAGLQPGIYTQINGKDLTQKQLVTEIKETKPGEVIILSTETNTYKVTTTQNPNNTELPFIGINGLKKDVLNDDTIGYKITKQTRELLFWIFTINLGIGAFNALPLGPTDGGQMFRTFIVNKFGKVNGKKIAKIVTIVLIIAIIIRLLSSLEII